MEYRVFYRKVNDATWLGRPKNATTAVAALDKHGVVHFAWIKVREGCVTRVLVPHPCQRPEKIVPELAWSIHFG
jgi:hypothetical protein